MISDDLIFYILFSLIGLLKVSPTMVCLLVVCYIETRSPIFKQERILLGIFKYLFTFRYLNAH